MLDPFLADLIRIAPAAGGGAYAFADDKGGTRGWVQFIVSSPVAIEIHRIWTLKPGKGNGSAMLDALCKLADKHQIELILKALPFGRKPYPMSGEQLMFWYERHGFRGTEKRMIRPPRPVAQGLQRTSA